MIWLESVQKLIKNILSLGVRRLVLLGLSGVLVFTAVIVGGMRLTRPAQQVLYSGLSKQDAAKIASALRDANIKFDTNAEATTIYVPYGQGAKARMRMAQLGLPNSTTNGYELFDKIGSFGLTSFMQEITKLRAIEGELARTIQTINGIKSARVHIVLPNPSSFRQKQEPPSASVVLRANSLRENLPSAAIRHLVAAAIPGLKPKDVTLVSSDGRLLASHVGPGAAGPNRVRRLERELSQNVKKNIAQALAPYLSSKNFRISVTTRVDADRKKAVEKIFIPNSRVERSVRVVRENSDSQNVPRAGATSVKQNLPNKKNTQANVRKKTEVTQKRSETTNYEISSRTTRTNYSGYQIKALSVAVVINKNALPQNLRGPSQKVALKTHLVELEKIIEAATGFNQKRGDKLKVAVMEFSKMSAVVPDRNKYLELLFAHLATLINGLTIIIVTILIGLFVIRPLIKYLKQITPSTEPEDQILIAAPDTPNPRISSPDKLSFDGHVPNDIIPPDDNKSHDARQRFRSMVESNEDDAVMIMKQWLTEGAAA